MSEKVYIFKTGYAKKFHIMKGNKINSLCGKLNDPHESQVKEIDVLYVLDETERNYYCQYCLAKFEEVR